MWVSRVFEQFCLCLCYYYYVVSTCRGHLLYFTDGHGPTLTNAREVLSDLSLPCKLLQFLKYLKKIRLPFSRQTPYASLSSVPFLSTFRSCTWSYHVNPLTFVYWLLTRRFSLLDLQGPSIRPVRLSGSYRIFDEMVVNLSEDYIRGI